MSAAVTSADFDTQVLQSDVPVLVDFWAVWCGPCRRVAPEVDAVAEQLQGKVKVYKVNVDEEPDLAGRYGIQSIPTVAVFAGGRPVTGFVGAHPAAAIGEFLDGVIAEHAGAAEAA